MAVALVTAVQRYIGLSADTKPPAAKVGARFYETDTGRRYVFDGTAWSAVR